VPSKLRREACALLMALKWLRNDAAMRVVPTIPKREEYVSRMERRRNDAALMDVTTK
jgi:hypothetical protein